MLLSSEFEMSPEEVASLLMGLKTKFGVNFNEYDKSALQQGIQRAMQAAGVTSIFALWSAILKDASWGKKTIERILEKDTSFFRNPLVWKAIREECAPQLKDLSDLRIWSAGCATGEEAYSIAILLQETGLLDRSQIWATDLRESAIEKAKKGGCHKSDWSRFLNAYFDYNAKGKPLSHFIQKAEGNCVRPALLEKIHFERHDLSRCENLETSFHIIFCRGVLPFFNMDLKTRVIQHFLQHLQPGGFIVFDERVELPPMVQLSLSAVTSAKGIYQPTS